MSEFFIGVNVRVSVYSDYMKSVFTLMIRTEFTFEFTPVLIPELIPGNTRV